jgi:hypothetical protein
MCLAALNDAALLDVNLPQIEQQLPNISSVVRSTLTRVASDCLRKVVIYPPAIARFRGTRASQEGKPAKPYRNYELVEQPLFELCQFRRTQNGIGTF